MKQVPNLRPRARNALLKGSDWDSERTTAKPWIKLAGRGVYTQRYVMTLIPRLLCALLLLSPLSTLTAQSSKAIAEKRIASCYATDLSGKGCTPQLLLRDGKVLLSSYTAGDRSVLGSLMRVNALSVGMYSLDSRFFAQAMLNNLDGFLSALAQTQDTKDTWRNSGAVGAACGCPGLEPHQFNSVREKLRNVPDGSASFVLAQQCRNDLEDANATLIFTYFPPNVFRSRAGGFMVHWYSSVLYKLDEKPLWPPDPEQVIYRFTWMRSFHDQVSIMMRVLPEGNGQLRLQIYKRVPQQLETRTQSLSKEQVGGVMALIKDAGFWGMATEGEGPQGTDGAEWVLEGVQGGRYHIATRWDASGTTYGMALLELLRLSDYNPPINEIY